MADRPKQDDAGQRYDCITGQKAVLSRAGIDSVLAQFETVSYDDLDVSYKEYSDPDEKFRHQLEGTRYRIVRGAEIYQYVVGKTRVKSFLCTDAYYTGNEADLNANKEQYWLVDEKLLYLILDFMQVLDQEGYDSEGFYVREGHRHPHYNYTRGGASQSQHIYGKAADLVIEDINRDGSITDEDKDICLELLEELVGNKGGMGLYPGTMTIHIDTRGHRARWNSYVPANKKV